MTLICCHSSHSASVSVSQDLIPYSLPSLSPRGSGVICDSTACVCVGVAAGKLQPLGASKGSENRWFCASVWVWVPGTFGQMASRSHWWYSAVPLHCACVPWHWHHLGVWAAEGSMRLHAVSRPLFLHSEQLLCCFYVRIKHYPWESSKTSLYKIKSNLKQLLQPIS